MNVRIAIGCMTGTSIDGIDVAAVRVDGHGTEIRAQFIAGATRPLGPVADALRRLARGDALAAREIACAAREFALAHIETMQDLALKQTPDFIAVHGQTVFHEPPLSWQLLNPAPIAAAFGAPVVFDFRAADVAAGGQGAPITPLADFVCFASPDERRVVVNLGGFANFTSLPRRTSAFAENVREIAGGDICVCNQLLDGLARRCLRADCDLDGAAATAGTPIVEFTDALVERLARQAGSGRSLGSRDEPHAWKIDPPVDARPADILASATHAIGRTIAAKIPACDRLLIAGGGAENLALRATIAKYANTAVEGTEAHGVPGRYREALQIGVLGALCDDGVPITLPQITGVASPAPLAASWTRCFPRSAGAQGGPCSASPLSRGI